MIGFCSVKKEREFSHHFLASKSGGGESTHLNDLEQFFGAVHTSNRELVQKLDCGFSRVNGSRSISPSCEVLRRRSEREAHP